MMKNPLSCLRPHGGRVRWGALLACLILPAAAMAADSVPPPRDTLPAAPDTAAAAPDSAAADTEAQEGSFQDDMDALFRPDSTGIDTAQLSVGKINAVRFDYRLMKDTVAIVLRDPLQGRFYVHPFLGPVTSPFGLRNYFWHFGTDIRVRRGDAIRCALDGIVRVIQNDRYGYGKVVVVRHQKGLETLYGHLSRTMVAVQQRVKAGEIIGSGGRTGRSTGPHLHFEIRYCGEPFDPGNVVDLETGILKTDTLRLCRADFAYLAEARSLICHVIRRGDCLGTIARHYGTTVRKLCALNGIRGTTLLRPGRKIIVRKEAVPPPPGTDAAGSAF